MAFMLSAAFLEARLEEGTRQHTKQSQPTASAAAKTTPSGSEVGNKRKTLKIEDEKAAAIIADAHEKLRGYGVDPDPAHKERRRRRPTASHPHAPAPVEETGDEALARLLQREEDAIGDVQNDSHANAQVPPPYLPATAKSNRSSMEMASRNQMPVEPPLTKPGQRNTSKSAAQTGPSVLDGTKKRPKSGGTAAKKRPRTMKKAESISTRTRAEPEPSVVGSPKIDCDALRKKARVLLASTLLASEAAFGFLKQDCTAIAGQIEEQAFQSFGKVEEDYTAYKERCR